MHFKVVLEGSGFVKDGSFSFGDYKSEDGVVVERRVESYRSGARAREEMERRIRKASKVIERGAKRERQGRQKAERAVLMFGGSRSGSPQAVVLWTHGSKLYVLESSSLKHVLAFEKQVYEAPLLPQAPRPEQRPVPLPQ